jgi:hypothetical protein
VHGFRTLIRDRVGSACISLDEASATELPSSMDSATYIRRSIPIFGNWLKRQGVHGTAALLVTRKFDTGISVCNLATP